jgi:hypothetical protein
MNLYLVLSSLLVLFIPCALYCFFFIFIFIFSLSSVSFLLFIQFFITYERQPHLNQQNTVFGKVIGGWEVLDAMEKLQSTGKKDRPVNCPVISNISIHANPLAEGDIVYPSKSGPPERCA